MPNPRRATLPDHPLSLTAREHQCMTHILQGLTAKEVGKRLGLSERTVQIYLQAVLRVTDSKNIVQAAVRFDRAVLRG